MNPRSLSRLLVLGAAFMTTAVVASTSITVTELRLLDKRIQADVMNVLANNPTLTGRVSVESRDQVVSLGGYLQTEGQVTRAGREAARVPGVKLVVNEIRPRVGIVTH